MDQQQFLVAYQTLN